MKDRFSQDEIAEGVAVSQPTVQRWLKGMMPGSVELGRLADYFGVTTDWLMGRDGAPAPPTAMTYLPINVLVDDALADASEMRERLKSMEMKLKKLRRGSL